MNNNKNKYYKLTTNINYYYNNEILKEKGVILLGIFPSSYMESSTNDGLNVNSIHGSTVFYYHFLLIPEHKPIAVPIEAIDKLEPE